MAQAFAEATGVPTTYEPLPVDALDDDDQRAMFTWFTELPAYRADFAATRALAPEPSTLVAWVAEQLRPGRS